MERGPGCRRGHDPRTSEWRASWLAYGIPGAYGLAHTALFLILFAGAGGAPSAGCLLTLGAFVTMSLAAWWMRPDAVTRSTRGPAEAIRRSRQRRRRRRAGRSTTEG